MSEIVLPAPAKLNLFLHVTGRRPDGYHELQTVFQLLDWGDELRLEATSGSRIERLAELPGVEAHEDLSLRAARALQNLARRRGRPAGGARITLDKRIPNGSGLGGASSDAATVLLGLNHLWGCGFDQDELAALGGELGADVPVFVHGQSAWAEGVGERLTPLDLGERHYLLVFPGVPVPTASLFQAADLVRDTAPLAHDADLDFARLGNAFFPLVKRRFPVIADVAEALAVHGEPRLTGSGGTLFLEVLDLEHGKRLARDLKKHYNVRAVRGRERSAVFDTLPRLHNEPKI